jgi:hypothetical protein
MSSNFRRPRLKPEFRRKYQQGLAARAKLEPALQFSQVGLER